MPLVVPSTPAVKSTVRFWSIRVIVSTEGANSILATSFKKTGWPAKLTTGRLPTAARSGIRSAAKRAMTLVSWLFSKTVVTSVPAMARRKADVSFKSGPGGKRPAIPKW